jgi:hypothetical protein
MTEPIQKRFKYSHLPTTPSFMFNTGYLTEDGKTITITDALPQQLQHSHQSIKPKPIMHIQRVEHADVYIIANMKNNYNTLDITDITNINNRFIDINKSYNLTELFHKLKNGDFSIGTIQDYNTNRNRDNQYIITDINDYYDDNNSELILHYTTLKTYPDNCAWRTITWDLFADYVPKDM